MNGSSRGLNTASMPADRAEANQGVGKVPKTEVSASLRDTPARKLGKALSRMASRQNRSSFSFTKTVPQDLIVYTDGSVTKDQSGWGFAVKLRRSFRTVINRKLPLK